MPQEKTQYMKGKQKLRREGESPERTMKPKTV